jgi:outer membrane immunogenic protein
MICRVLLSAAACAVLAPPAFAANIYDPGDISYTPVAIPVPSWTGWYLGANVGGTWRNDEAGYSQLDGNGAFSAHLDDSSVIGGGQIGYNWQVGALVFGPEADISGRALSHGATVFPFHGDTMDAVTLADEQNWVGTVRARIGYAAGNWLLYATGGFAYGGVAHSMFENRITAPGQDRLLSDSLTATGWTVGGGIEWALAPHWSVGVEYLYVNLGTDTLIQPAVTSGICFPASSSHFEDRSDIVRAKLNYHILPDYIPLK